MLLQLFARPEVVLPGRGAWEPALRLPRSGRGAGAASCPSPGTDKRQQKSWTAMTAWPASGAFSFETLRGSNHAGCRFTEKTQFFHPLSLPDGTVPPPRALLFSKLKRSIAWNAATCTAGAHCKKSADYCRRDSNSDTTFFLAEKRARCRFLRALTAASGKLVAGGPPTVSAGI